VVLDVVLVFLLFVFVVVFELDLEQIVDGNDQGVDEKVDKTDVGLDYQ
jgi:hypothetical protein